MPEGETPNASTDEQGTEGNLRRDVGTLVGTFVVINAIIGTGIFKKAAPIARLTGSLEASFAVWILGGVIAVAGALSLAELAAAIPRTGGLYEYLRRAYGPMPAFLLGFTRLFLLIPSALGSFAKLAAESFVALVGWRATDATLDRVALTVIAVCTLVNVVGVRLSTLQQAIITAFKYVGVLMLALVGLFFAFTPLATSTLPEAPEPIAREATFLGLFAALVSVMWAYDGWADLSSLAGEVKDPTRSLPRALVAGTAATTIVYLLVNGAYARVLGFEGLTRSTVGEHMAAAHLAHATLGPMGVRALSGLVFVSCIGASMGTLLTGPRVLVAMATDGVFFETLGRVDPRSGVPRVAVLVGALLGAGYVLVQSFEQMTEGFVVGMFPFYMAGAIAVVVLRRREPDLPRPFRVPLHPLPEVVFVTGSACLLLGAVKDFSLHTLAALGVVALGIPFEWVFRRTRAKRA